LAIINPSTINRSHPSNTNHEMRLKIGKVACSFIFHDNGLHTTLSQLYSDFLTGEPADVVVDMEVTERLNPAEIEAALAEAEFIHEGEHFRTTNMILTGEHDAKGRYTSMTLEKVMLNPNVKMNALNRGLSMAYYTACNLKFNEKPPALLVHSCAILRHGRVLLFAGPCESGKSTIARLCGQECGRVINDETVLLYRPQQENDTLQVENVPFVGEITRLVDAAAPLSCVLLLKQSERTMVRRLERMEAYLRFMRQVISPAYVGQREKRAIYALIAEFADEVTRTVPFYELEFNLNGELLWQVVEELEKALEMGE
jgi:hypothetical protein